jgi:hypothetical protein
MVRATAPIFFSDSLTPQSFHAHSDLSSDHVSHCVEESYKPREADLVLELDGMVLVLWIG